MTLYNANLDKIKTSYEKFKKITWKLEESMKFKESGTYE
jgi:hypothetical protein